MSLSSPLFTKSSSTSSTSRPDLVTSAIIVFLSSAGYLLSCLFSAANPFILGSSLVLDYYELEEE